MDNTDSLSQGSECTSSPDTPNRPRQRRKTSRSRKGCTTCRSKRVKCDEQKPKCNRCTRLTLTCLWESGRQSVKDRRRGLGPFKRRESDQWRPGYILPSTQDGPGDLSLETSHEVTLDDSVDDLDWVFQTWFEAERSPANETLDTARWTTESEQSEDNIFSGLIRTSPANSPSNISSEPRICSISPVLGTNHILMANRLLLSPSDQRAIHYYQNIFSSSHVSKTSAWSTNALLLRLGFEKIMTMHFILATQLNELDRNGETELKQLAEYHFLQGRLLFTQAIRSAEADPSLADHLDILGSVFFSYLYLSRRRIVDRELLRSLSQDVGEHVRKHKLDDLFSDAENSSPYIQILSTATIDSPGKRSLLARLIHWIFFKDVQTCFHGYGGTLASYINRSQQRRGALYQSSRVLLVSNWGSEYPEHEVIDDVQNSMTLELLYHTFGIMQDINNLRQDPSDVDIAGIERQFDYLERTYSPVFHLSSNKSEVRTRLLVNADSAIGRFHAARIYFFRSTISTTSPSLDTIVVPAAVQKSLSSLLSIAQRLFHLSTDRLLEGMQWSLFMAGIETLDSIHREWILQRMKRDALKTGLETVIKIQDMIGHRLHMNEVKDIIFRVGCEPEGMASSGSLMAGSWNQAMRHREDNWGNGLSLW